MDGIYSKRLLELKDLKTYQKTIVGLLVQLYTSHDEYLHPIGMGNLSDLWNEGSDDFKEATASLETWVEAFSDKETDAYIYGMFDGRDLIGICRAFKAENNIYIGTLIVDANYRNGGIGRTLLELAIEKLRIKGTKQSLTLSCYAGNVMGMKLYESIGMKPYAYEMAMMLR